ncbi:MAG: lipid-A-disaccharide synthase [Simkaniaceae bacterium]
MTYDLFVFAGEVSGDLHGEKLLKALYELNPHLKIKGVGGPKMRALGMDLFMPMEEFEVMGFVDVISSLPKLMRHFKAIKKEILKSQPKGVVSIDYPGFNLRLAQALYHKKSEAKRIHYICPSVWAWGKRRIPKMERSLDRLLTILPFEPEIFSRKKIHVSYVGHPLISRIHSHEYDQYWRKIYGISDKQQILSLFPGSRQKEIERNFPMQLRVAKRLQKENPDLLIAVSCSDQKFKPLLDGLIIDSSHSYELMRASHMALATSGTVTLELALHQIPTIVNFAIRPLDVFIAQSLLRINLPYFALPNIIAKQEIFPELFGPYLTEEALYQKGIEFLLSEYKRRACIENCHHLKKLLGEKDASLESARAILELIT